jgi:hypothetical protein
VPVLTFPLPPLPIQGTSLSTSDDATISVSIPATAAVPETAAWACLAAAGAIVVAGRLVRLKRAPQTHSISTQ